MEYIAKTEVKNNGKKRKRKQRRKQEGRQAQQQHEGTEKSCVQSRSDKQRFVEPEQSDLRKL